METWIITAGAIVVNIVATYAVLRSKVARHEDDLDKHRKEDKEYHKENDRKMDAQFKRIDEIDRRCTIVEQENLQSLSIQKADERFVSKAELELHMKNIELTSSNTNKSVEKIEGKLSELVQILQNVSINFQSNKEK